MGVVGMVLWLILGALGLGPKAIGLASVIPHPSTLVVTAENALAIVLGAAGCLAAAVLAVVMGRAAGRLSRDSVWRCPHFSGATLAQFLYVAAQAGIFSFLINYMTSEPPGLPAAWLNENTRQWVELRTAFAGSDFTDMPSLAGKLSDGADPVSGYLASTLSDRTRRALARYEEGSASPATLRVALMQDLNSLIQKQGIYSSERFDRIALQEETRALLSQDPAERNEARLNRLLLADAYPAELPFRDGTVAITNQAAANLASFGFICFLLGRVTGAGLLRRFSAHKIVALYSVLNVAACFVVFLKLGWASVACVFLSYFFMSIMFPTIFALGIFGLGERAKRASVVHRDGHRGWRHPAQGDGRRRRPLRHVPRVHRAHVLLCAHRLLRLRLAPAGRGGIAERGTPRGPALRTASGGPHCWSAS